MKRLRRFKGREDGYSLAGVLIIFIVATVLGMSIVALSINSMNISNKEHDDQSAFYIAESGTTYRVPQVQTLVDSATAVTEQYIKDVKDNPMLYPSFDPEDEDNVKEKFFEELDKLLFPSASGGINHTEIYTSLELIKGHQPEAVITVEREIIVDPAENPRTYNIVSEGKIGDESRLVHLPIEINWHSKPEYAILTKEGIEIRNGNIIGDIGTINPDSNVVVFPGGNPNLDGEIFVPDGNEYAVSTDDEAWVEVPEWMDVPIPPKSIDEDTEIPNLPVFPEIPKYPTGLAPKPDIVGNWGSPRETTLTSDGSYQLIKILGGMN